MRLFSSSSVSYLIFFFFFFNDTATTEIYTLSLHDALPISYIAKDGLLWRPSRVGNQDGTCSRLSDATTAHREHRSEEHTSELQSLTNLVCRLLLEKKKKKKNSHKKQPKCN